MILCISTINLTRCLVMSSLFGWLFPGDVRRPCLDIICTSCSLYILYVVLKIVDLTEYVFGARAIGCIFCEVGWSTKAVGPISVMVLDMLPMCNSCPFVKKLSLFETLGP